MNALYINWRAWTARGAIAICKSDADTWRHGARPPATAALGKNKFNSASIHMIDYEP